MQKQFTFEEVISSFEEKIQVLKENTDFLKGINEKEIKDILLGASDAYILLHNGNLLKNGELFNQQIKDIWYYRFATLLCIRNDNCIICDKENVISNFICDSYKKIVVGENVLLALLENGNLRVLTSLEECVGIQPEHFINVSDMGIEKTKYDEKAFVIQNNEKKYLFIEND